MFKRSRTNIILSIMGSGLLLFLLTLSVIIIASFRDTRKMDRASLEHFAESFDLDGNAPGQEIPHGHGPGPEKDDPWDDDRPDYQLSTFYTVVLDKDGNLISFDDGGKDVYSKEELVRIAREASYDDDRNFGRKGSLSYLVRSDDDGTVLVAFMDNTVSERGLSMMVRNVLLAGGGAMVLLFFLSLWLSKRIIKPLEENDRKQKQFISDAGHELKTPIAVIDANAELLSREIGESEWLANIRYENDRMSVLVKQLLDLSRAENTEPPAEEVDLSRAVTGEALAFESLAFDQGKTLISDIEDGIVVSGSKAQLAQLTSILLDNAVRHSTKEQVFLSLKRKGHFAQLDVENAGEAIPPEKLEHLFDRFYRVDEARNSETGHYGLGLAIAKAVAEKHGGSIGVACENGVVRFSVTLPVK